MQGRAPTIKIRYNDKEKECNIIKNYSEFLRTCYQYFEITKEEEEYLKIFVLNYGDEVSIENEEDFNENLDLDENNEIIYILKLKIKPKEQRNENKIPINSNFD